MASKQHEERQSVDDLPHDQALLFSALREEFNAKIGSLKAWGLTALVGGQVAAGAIATYIGPSHVARACADACAKAARMFVG